MNDACLTPRLTIAIPTWRRPAQVARRLAELQPQLCASVQLIIFENGETPETKAVVQPFLSEGIRYQSSSANFGPAFNMLRCIRESRSEWLWILGDDDPVLPDAVPRILGWLETAGDARFISTRAYSVPDGALAVVGFVGELFAATTLGEALFMSSTVWRRSALEAQVGVFIDSAYTMCPHLCAMVQMLEEGANKGHVRGEHLVSPPPGSPRWSRLRYLRVQPAVIECFSNENTRAVLADALWPGWQWAAYDSLKEIDSPRQLRAWRDAFWIGLIAFRRDGTCGRRFPLNVLKRSFSYWFHRGAKYEEWPLVALLPEHLALRLAKLFASRG